MYRVTRMANTFYAIEVNSVEDEIENLEGTLEAGDLAILCNDLDEIKEITEALSENLVIVEND